MSITGSKKIVPNRFPELYRMPANRSAKPPLRANTHQNIPMSFIGFSLSRLCAMGTMVPAKPPRFSLACQSFSFLIRGVQRGYFSFQWKRSEIMKADELLI
jgi:hypothetical protein